MDIQTNAGILYPENAVVQPAISSEPTLLPVTITVPHKAWSLAKDIYDKAFYKISNCKPDYVFVLAPLHKGKVCYDDPVKIYTYTNSPISHPLLEKDNDVCSEEFSYEVLIPYIKAYFPNAKRIAFFAVQKDKSVSDFRKWLEREYPSSVFIESFNSGNCPQVWK